MAVPYQFTIETTDVKYAGTDAKVFIDVIGKSNSVRRIHLATEEGGFKQGSICTIEKKLQDVEHPINKIRVSHDNSGVGPGWHLQSIIIEKPLRRAEDSVQYEFYLNKWLSKSDEDRCIVREMAPFRYTENVGGKRKVVNLQDDKDYQQQNRVTVYKVTVKTGTAFGAGTDANVFCTLYGENGDSGERKLEHEINGKINKFENDAKDEFNIEAVNLGRLRSLNIRHDNKHFAAAWLLDHVKVTNMTTLQTTSFPCGRWLSTKDDDHQISRDLAPA